MKNIIAKVTRAAGQSRHARYYAIHRRFEAYTMIPSEKYVNNLRLVEKFANVAGAVVECGVWRGGMIGGIATLLGAPRTYHLFDSFEGLPPAKEVDGQAAQAWQSDKQSPGFYDNCAAPETAAREAMQLAGASQFTVTKGWFKDTLPDFKPSGGIAVLRLDGDWYDSTMECLTFLYPHVAPGGVVIMDDYHVWDGCTRAVHDYLSKSQVNDRICQFDNDVCYFVKR